MTTAIQQINKDLCSLVDNVLDHDILSVHTEKSTSSPKQQRVPHLPVLIIPGFMSSGLEIHESEYNTKWEGQRLWLNLKALGLSRFIHKVNKKDSYEASLARARARFADESLYEDEDDDDIEKQQQQQSDEEGGLSADDWVENNKEVATRNRWIHHISLMSDLKSDPPGIKVRPMTGLKGVDYLLPGALTNFVSYVFGPVIKVLNKVGYANEVNLDASPNDWRLPPSELEKRDGYFTKTMQKVETLYNNNGRRPVVLVCHSLGCLVGEYFLRFAHAKDSSWCETYIHTYMPVGAPHLGAPFTLRGIISGDKMGLETFLNDSEALAMSRSLGSIPWLIPSAIPPLAPAAAIVRREGAFEVSIDSTIDVQHLLDHRAEESMPKKLQLKLRYGKRHVTSSFVPIVNGKVTFKGLFVFATPPEGPSSKQCCFRCCQCCILKCAKCACCSDNHLIVSINEPGAKWARKSKKHEEQKNKCCGCNKDKWCSLWFPLLLIEWAFLIAGYLLYIFAYKIWVKMVDYVSRFSGGRSQLAVSAPIDLREYVDMPESVDVQVIMQNNMKQCRCCRKKAKTRLISTTLNIRWISPDVPTSTCQVAEIREGHRVVELQTVKKHNKEWEYEASSGYGMLKKEGLETTINGITELYNTDQLNPRCSNSIHPPVKNIKAIYGINLPTEVGSIYRRKKIFAERNEKVKPRYELDEDAKLLLSEEKSFYKNDNGILFETRETPQTVVEGEIVNCSGDGTVRSVYRHHVPSCNFAYRSYFLSNALNAGTVLVLATC